MKKYVVIGTVLLCFFGLVLIFMRAHFTGFAIHDFKTLEGRFEERTYQQIDFPNASYPSYFLDVGSVGDNDSSRGIYLNSSGVSGLASSNGVTFRTIPSGGYMYFYVNTSELELSSGGVPFKNAILTIVYNDTGNTSDCQTTPQTAYCRSYVGTLLNYGALEYQALQPLGGLSTRKWNKSTEFIENSPWQTLRAINGSFIFRIYNMPIPGNPELPIDSINFSFVDEGIFNELRDVQRAERGLVREDYIETNTIDREDYEAPVILYTRNYLQKIYPQSIPSSGEITNNFDLFEVAGEDEPLSIGLYPFENFENVSIDVSDFRNGDQIISKGNVSIYRVVADDLRWGSNYFTYFGTQPSYLEEAGNFGIRENVSQQIWLTFHVPAGTRAGVYTGELIVNVDGVPIVSGNVNLAVYDISLEKPASMPMLYGYPYNIRTTDSWPRSVAAENIAEHNVNSIIWFTPILKVNTTTKNVTINFTSFREDMGYLAELGILPKTIWIDMREEQDKLWHDICGNTNYYADNCVVNGVSNKYDVEYSNLLNQYREFFSSLGVTDPILTYGDEPGDNIVARRRSSHHLQLAKQAGFDTYITYYPNVEKPLAGFVIGYDEPISDVVKNVPDWVENDSVLISYWDFEGSGSDKSGHGHDAALHGDASIVNNHLFLDGDSDYASGPYSSWFATKNLSFVAWIYPESSGMQNEGYIFAMEYDFYHRYNGDGLDVIYTDHLSDNTMMPKTELKEKRWSQVAFVYNGSSKILYRDGVPYVSEQATGNISKLPFSEWVIGDDPYPASGPSHGWDGYLDEIMVFNRPLNDEEIEELYFSQSQQGQMIEIYNLTTSIARDESVPQILRFTIDDFGNIGTSVTKNILVNGEVVWSVRELDEEYQMFSVDLGMYLNPDSENNVTFMFVNDGSREDNFTLYFVDDLWRNREWVAQGGSSKWSMAEREDPFGDLGPLGVYLDYRVYPLGHVKPKTIERTLREGDFFSYYTTYAATSPVPVYNRFLHGVYSSALGASYVLTYAYQAYTSSQPYDELNGDRYGRPDTEAGRKGSANYVLSHRAWDSEMRDTLPWEMLREGEEDSRVIAALEKSIRNHPGALADEAEEYLNNLLAKPSRDYDRYARARYESLRPIESYADRSDNILYDLCGNSTDYGCFDDIRITMLEYIQLLESQNGEGEPIDNPGSGGGSGGGKTMNEPLINNTVECISVWDCREWSRCVNGKQKRACVDLNRCDLRKITYSEEIPCENEIRTNETSDEDSVTQSGQRMFGKYSWIFAGALLAAIVIVVVVLLKARKINRS